MEADASGFGGGFGAGEGECAVEGDGFEGEERGVGGGGGFWWERAFGDDAGVVDEEFAEGAVGVGGDHAPCGGLVGTVFPGDEDDAGEVGGSAFAAGGAEGVASGEPVGEGGACGEEEGGERAEEDWGGAHGTLGKCGKRGLGSTGERGLGEREIPGLLRCWVARRACGFLWLRLYLLKT